MRSRDLRAEAAARGPRWPREDPQRLPAPGLAIERRRQDPRSDLAGRGIETLAGERDRGLAPRRRPAPTRVGEPQISPCCSSTPRGMTLTWEPSSGRP